MRWPPNSPDEGSNPSRYVMKKVIKYYLHSDKEENYEIADDLGLSEDARATFRHACEEIELDLEVDLDTGYSRIIAVDGVNLSEEQ